MLHYKICVTLVLVFVLTAVVLVMIGFQEVVKHTITNLLVKLKILSGMLGGDRKSTRLNSSHQIISYAVFCLKKKTEFGKGRISPMVDRSTCATCTQIHVT